MDLLSNALATLRLDASIFLHSTFCQAWVIDTGAIDVATFHVVAHGNCWLHLPRHQPVALHEGDLLVLPHNAPHLVTHSPDAPLPETPRNAPAEVVSGPSTTLICGTVAFSQNYWNPLVDALPEYVIQPTTESSGTTLGKAIEALINECERNEAGSEVIIDRLADILFIEVLRGYVSHDTDSTYLAAVADPKISCALEAFHADTGADWSVDMLADISCMSRSAFAERFQKFVGSPPMHYIARWRMHRAHNQLTEGIEPIGTVASSCGYQSEEAFAKAFRREFGMSPAAVRRRETAGENAGDFPITGDEGASTKILYSPLEANQLRLKGSTVFIDVRAPERYDTEHIPGAVNIPEMFLALSFTTPEGLREMQKSLMPLLRRAGINGSETVIVYEDDLGTLYGGSCRGYFQLHCFGHPNAGILDGGFNRWHAEGFPTGSTRATPVPGLFESVLKRGSMATIDDMIMALDHPDIKLLDTRDKDEWLGITSSPLEYYNDDFLPRKGRIPGARWIDWHKFMEPRDGVSRFRPADETRAICAQAGLYPDDHIIVYCFKGARSSNTWVALKLAGFRHVRNYYGSWNEWSRNAALPAVSVRLVG